MDDFKIMYFNATKNYNNILINFDFTLEKLTDIYLRKFLRWDVEFQNFISALKKKKSFHSLTFNVWHKNKSKRTKVKMLVIDNVTHLLKKKDKINTGNFYLVSYLGPCLILYQLMVIIISHVIMV